MAKKEQRQYIGTEPVVVLSRRGVSDKKVRDALLEATANRADQVSEEVGSEVDCSIEDPATGEEIGRVFSSKAERQRRLFFGLDALQYEKIFGERKAA